MAGADKDEINRIRLRLTNISDEQGNKAINGLAHNDDGTVEIEHRPGASDEIAEEMIDLGYEQRNQLSETTAQEQADADPGHVVTIFART